MSDNINQFFLSIAFSRGSKPYYFSCPTDEFKNGEYVIVETIRGTEVGVVVREPLPMSEYKSDLALKPIIKSGQNETARHYQNLNDAQEALAFCAKQIEYLKLDMHLISAEYTFDRDKIIFTYVADQRVDFRELLKILASQLRTRIELRQIEAVIRRSSSVVLVWAFRYVVIRFYVILMAYQLIVLKIKI